MHEIGGTIYWYPTLFKVSIQSLLTWYIRGYIVSLAYSVTTSLTIPLDPWEDFGEF